MEDFSFGINNSADHSDKNWQGKNLFLWNVNEDNSFKVDVKYSIMFQYAATVFRF